MRREQEEKEPVSRGDVGAHVEGHDPRVVHNEVTPEPSDVKLWDVFLTDDFMSNRRTARQQGYLVLARSREEALATLRAERPTAFAYAKTVEAYETFRSVVWIGDVKLDKARAEAAYERAAANGLWAGLRAGLPAVGRRTAPDEQTRVPGAGEPT